MKIKINNFFNNKKAVEKSKTKVKKMENREMQNKEMNHSQEEKSLNMAKDTFSVEKLKYQNENQNQNQNNFAKDNNEVKRVRNAVKITNETINSNNQGNISSKRINKEKVDLRTSLENLFKNKNKLTKGYYLLLVAMICLSTASVTLASKAYNIFSKEDYVSYSSKEEDKSLEEAVTSSTNVDTNLDANKQNSAESSSETNNKDTTDAIANKTKVSEKTKTRNCQKAGGT